MAWNLTALIALALFVSISVEVAQSQHRNEANLVFSDHYFVMGVIYLPYAEIKEPFQTYFDLKKQKSRVDYYGDLVKTYQRQDTGEFGTSYKIAYMPDTAGNPYRTCFQVNGTSNSSITVQTVLPDLSGFEFMRVESCPNPAEVDLPIVGRPPRNDLCELWTSINKVEQKTNKYSAWITRDKNGNPIPNYYVMKGYNTLLGSHYDKYMVKYQNYNTDPFEDSVFEVDNGISCHGFPGPGLEHVGENNPIKEFIDHQSDHIHAAFDKFKVKHNKRYQHIYEHETRKNNFMHNYRFVNSKNRAGLSYRLAVNHLADKTDLEIKQLRGRTHLPGYNGGKPFLKSRYNPKMPDSLDWRLFGAVNPVKDQAVCGSCWSFGTVGTIEGSYFLKFGKLVRFSEQQLIDCSWNEQNNGCDGGEDFRAYKYIMRTSGLGTDEDYGPYLGQDGRCHDREINRTVTITGYVNVTSGDAEALKLALVNQGPISVGIDASHKAFSFYSNGVYYEPTCGKKPEELDHSVLAVGYGTMNGEDYWLIKNSWSTYWGNDGYVLMSQKDNNCGVTTSPTYVNL